MQVDEERRAHEHDWRFGTTNLRRCGKWERMCRLAGPAGAHSYARHLGLEVQRDDAGLVVHMPCREALIGNFMLPALHGGVLGALIELTGRVAAQSQDTETRCPRILDSHINYLRSAQAIDFRQRRDRSARQADQPGPGDLLARREEQTDRQRSGSVVAPDNGRQTGRSS